MNPHHERKTVTDTAVRQRGTRSADSTCGFMGLNGGAARAPRFPIRERRQRFAELVLALLAIPFFEA